MLGSNFVVLWKAARLLLSDVGDVGSKGRPHSLAIVKVAAGVCHRPSSLLSVASTSIEDYVTLVPHDRYAWIVSSP